MATNPELDTNLVENEQPPAVPTVNIEMNVNELNVVLAALQELPHRVADPILRSVMQQAQEQLKQ